MARRKGIRRIVLAGRLILLIAITLVPLGWFVFPLPLMTVAGVVLIPIGAITWIAGWVIEGFNELDD